MLHAQKAIAFHSDSFLLLNRSTKWYKGVCVFAFMWCWLDSLLVVLLVALPAGHRHSFTDHIPLLFVFNSSHLCTRYLSITLPCNRHHRMHACMHASDSKREKEKGNNESRALFSKCVGNVNVVCVSVYVSHHIVAIDIISSSPVFFMHAIIAPMIMHINNMCTNTRNLNSNRLNTHFPQSHTHTHSVRYSAYNNFELKGKWKIREAAASPTTIVRTFTLWIIYNFLSSFIQCLRFFGSFINLMLGCFTIL